MKRCILTLSVFLLAGAFVNTAVAVAIAWRSERRMAETTSHSFHVKNLNYWDVSRRNGLGIVLIDSNYGDRGRRSDSHEKQPTPPTFLLPAGSLITDPRSNPSMPLLERETLCGWPFLSFNGLVTSQDRSPRYGIKIDLIGTIVPWHPLWPGFAMNTVIYAAALWLLFVFPLALRRSIRVRRGQCTACGYPVGSSEVCTECGAALSQP